MASDGRSSGRATSHHQKGGHQNSTAAEGLDSPSSWVPEPERATATSVRGVSRADSLQSFGARCFAAPALPAAAWRSHSSPNATHSPPSDPRRSLGSASYFGGKAKRLGSSAE